MDGRQTVEIILTATSERHKRQLLGCSDLVLQEKIDSTPADPKTKGKQCWERTSSFIRINPLEYAQRQEQVFRLLSTILVTSNKTITILQYDTHILPKNASLLRLISRVPPEILANRDPLFEMPPRSSTYLGYPAPRFLFLFYFVPII